MLTAKHISHILEPNLRGRDEPPARPLLGKIVYRLLSIAYRLVWLACWLFILCVCLSGIGLICRCIWFSFHFGWTTF